MEGGRPQVPRSPRRGDPRVRPARERVHGPGGRSLNGRRILLVRAGALGDLLLLRRAIAGLDAAGYEVGLLAPGAAGRVLVDAGGSGVRVAHDFEAARFASLAAGHPGDDARAVLGGFDAAIAYTSEPRLIEGLRAVGLEVAAQSPRPVAMHASAWFAEPVKQFAPAAPTGVLPPLRPTADEHRAAHDIARSLDLPPRFLALHPGSGGRAKNWSPARFAEVAEQIAPGERWLLVEGPADAEAVAPLVGAAGAAPLRGVPLRTLGALLARCGLYVGNDSGVTHLAAAFAAPTVALFGPSDPALYAPLGRPVRVVRSPTAAMEGLGVEPVVAAARPLRSAAAELRAG